MKRFLGASLIVLALVSGAQAKGTAAAPAAAGNGFPQAGDILVRARAINIMPEVDSTIGAVGGKADFSNQLVPEVDFSYFFTKNIAAELILATSRHDATAHGTSVPSGDVKLGSAWVLPPTLTLQYHVTNFSGFKPYVGAGVNYTMYYSEKAGDLDTLDLKNSWGWALQAGVDVPITNKWGWNFDVKKLFVNADAKWSLGATHSTADIELDPWIVGTGVTYRF